MKCQILFSRKNKKNISKCHLMKFLPSMQSITLCLMKHYICMKFCENNITIITIAPDWRGIHIILFLFLHENLCCGYSLEVPH